MCRILLVFLVTLSIYAASTLQFVETLKVKFYAFEKMCKRATRLFANSTEDVNRYRNYRNKIVCGVKCSEIDNCMSFAYSAEEMVCRIFPNKMVNKTNTCETKTWDYAEVI
jgi:hypothetical protein